MLGNKRRRIEDRGVVEDGIGTHVYGGLCGDGRRISGRDCA